MRASIVILVLAYVLSQFYRAFLAVLAPVLEEEIGAGPEELATASGVWFLTFAAMQIPIGAALDRFGPRLPSALIFGIGGAGGAILFGLAQGPGQVAWAMALIGAGCAPVLMAAYFIYARMFPAAAFATLAGVTLGIGSMGNVASAAPMALAVETFGWRQSLFGLAAITGAIAVLIALVVRDPPRAEVSRRGSLLDVLRIPALYPIAALIAVNYAPAAAIRGLWAGPFARDVFGAGLPQIGTVTLVMGLAMIAGSFLYGPAARLAGTTKGVAFLGNLLGLVALVILALTGGGTLWTAAALLAAVGFFGSSYPLMMSHARGFIPAHLTGRGVTLMNLFSIGGVGVLQFATRPLYEGAAAEGGAAAGHVTLFWFFAGLLALGLVAYAFSKDRRD